MPFRQQSVFQWNLTLLANLIIASTNNKYDFNIAISGKRGSGKCISQHTILENIDKPIGYYKHGDILNTKSWDFINKKVVSSISTVIESGTKELYEVTLKNGKKIICSKDHKLFIEKNCNILELPLSSLNIGDKLICLKK